MRGPEDDLQDAVAGVLRQHGFLVAHFRGTSKGTAVQYDGVGFPDITAMRPNCPVLFIECKVNAPVTKHQRDWLHAGQGDGRYYAVVTPATMPAFVNHVRLLAKQYPLSDEWKQQLAQRRWREEMEKARRRANRKNK